MNFEELNYYEILGIKIDATKEEIKKAYFKVARKYHPDVNKSPDAEKIFKRVSEAYQTLYSDIYRRDYDSFILSGARRSGDDWSKNQPTYFDTTWLDKYLHKKTISLDDIEDTLKSLNNHEKYLSFEHFWMLIWTKKAFRIYNEGFVVKIFNIFLGNIDRNYIYSLSKNYNAKFKESYSDVVSKVESNLKKASKYSDKKISYLLKIIDDDKLFNIDNISGLALLNYDITIKLLSEIENFLKEHLVLTENERGFKPQFVEKKPWWKSKIFLLAMMGIILCLIIVLALSLWYSLSN